LFVSILEKMMRQRLSSFNSSRASRFWICPKGW